MADPLDTLGFVIPHSRLRGTHGPGCVQDYCTADLTKHRLACPGPHTADWRCAPGAPDNVHGAEPVLVRTPLREIFDTHYRTEAHFASYALLRDGQTLPRQPRILKGALPWIRSEGFEVVSTMLFADWDNPGHAPWTPETLSAFHETWARAAGPLATCGVYLSPKGARIVQPLSTWLVVEDAEASLRTWLDQLVAAGADPSIAAVHDWTRLMRAPHHRRQKNGQRVVSAWRDLSRMVAVEAPPPSAARRAARRRPASQPQPGGGAVIPLFAEDCPADWHAATDAIGAAIRDHVRADWRRCYMVLAGALCARGCPLDAVPSVVARAHVVDQSYPEWEAYLTDRVGLARWVAVRYASGEAVFGYHALAKEFPNVAEALDRTTTSGVEASVLAQLRAPGLPFAPLADAAATMEREVRGAYGVVAIAAPPGFGKTHTVVTLAGEKPPVGKPASPGARVAMSAPTHRLSVQTAAKLPGRSLRVFSPVSHKGPDGADTCIYAAAARALAEGGQSVEREFCEGRDREPCPERSRCPAYGGSEGAEDASLVVGVHGLVRELRGYAGTAGTLVVDEPGETVFTERVTLDQLRTAARYLDQFVERYAAAMAPLLAAFTLWVQAAPVDGNLVYVHDAVRIHAAAVAPELLDAAEIDPATPPEDLGEAVLLAAAGAISPKARTTAPPIRWSALAVARVNVARATELGQASRVLSLLWRAVTHAVPYAAAVEGEEEERSATVVGLNDDLVLALKHEGPVVVLDANAALHVPAMARVLGHAPKLVSLRVPDGAPIARTILATQATHKSWLPRGVPDWSTILPSLRAMVAWLLEDRTTRSVGLIAPMVLEAALAHAIDPDAPGPRAQWVAKGLSLRALAQARAQLAPVLAPYDGRWITGHYQALEGLDHMIDCEASVTLMDPRPNLGMELLRAQYLGLDPAGRIDQLAKAELEQAHGRLRVIRRERPGRQFHAGGLVPGGWEGHPVEVRTLPVGRPRTVAAMGAAEFRAARAASGMGLRELARAVKVSASTLGRYESGERAVPEAIAAALRALAPGVPETPLKKDPIQGVSGTPDGDDGGESGTGGFGNTRGPVRLVPVQGVSGTPDGDDPDGGGSARPRRARRIDLGALLEEGSRRPGPVACVAPTAGTSGRGGS